MDKSNVAVRRNGQPTIPPLPSERSSGATEPSTAETVAAPSRRFSFLTTLAWRSLGAVDETSDGSSPRTLKKKCHYNSAAAVASTTDSTSRSSSKSPPAYSNGPPGTDSAVAMSTPPVAEVLKFGPLHRDSTVVASVFRPKDEWLVLTTRELLRFRSLETLRSAFPQFSWLSDASNMSNYNANGGRATSSHPSSRRGSSGAGSTGGGPLASPVSRSSTWSSAFSSSTSYSHTPSVVQQPLVPAAKSVTADAAAPQPDLVVPLERILTVYKMEDGSPYFGAELWWLDGYGAAMNDGRATVLGSCNTQLLFATPAERGEWISRIRVAAWSALGASGRPRGGGTAPDTHDGHGDYVVPSRVRVRITRRFKELEPRYAGRHHVEIFPVVQRGLYEYRADQIEVRQKLLDGSTWYLALGRNLCYLAKVDRAVGPGGPDLLNVTFHVFGLLTLERLVGDLQPPERGDERFTLTFRWVARHLRTVNRGANL